MRIGRDNVGDRFVMRSFVPWGGIQPSEGHNPGSGFRGSPGALSGR